MDEAIQDSASTTESTCVRRYLYICPSQSLCCVKGREADTRTEMDELSNQLDDLLSRYQLKRTEKEDTEKNERIETQSERVDATNESDVSISELENC